MARSTVAVRFTGDTADLKRALGNIDQGMGKVSGRMSTAGASIAKFGRVAAIGLGAVGVGAVVMGKSLIDAATESQKVTKQTAAVIKSMGGASKVTAKQVENLSRTLSEKTGIDDELIQSGQNVLLTFGKVRNEVGKGNKIFDRATEAAVNMSVALGTDLSSANIQLGKALNDPIKGITALSRAGVSFTQEQKDLIRTLVETGDTLGAQKIILGELEKQFGGSAEAQATAGEKLAVVWGNLQEDLGERLLPLFESVATWLGTNLPAAMDWLSERIGPVIDGLASLVSDGFQAIADWWATHSETLSGYWTTFSDAATGAMGAVWAFIDEKVLPKFQEMLDWFVENEAAMVGALAAIATGFTAWAVSAGLAAAASLLAAWPLLAVAAAAGIVVGILYTLSNRGDGVVETFGRMIAACWSIAEGFGRAFGFIFTLFDQFRIGVGILWAVAAPVFGGILGIIRNVVGWIGSMIDKVQTLISWIKKIPALPKLSIPGGGGGGIFGIPGVPIFADGGVMPGPKGVHSLAMVAGGETILPTHKTGAVGAAAVYVTFAPQISIPTTMDAGAAGQSITEALAAYVRRNGAGDLRQLLGV